MSYIIYTKERYTHFLWFTGADGLLVRCNMVDMEDDQQSLYQAVSMPSSVIQFPQD